MRAKFLLYLIVIILAGLFLFRRESTGRAQRSQAPELAGATSNPQSLPSTHAAFALHGTILLTRPVTEDLREEQRQQIIRYFQAQIAATPARRDALWRPDFSSLAAYRDSVQRHRSHLCEMLGVTDVRLGTPRINILSENAGLRVEDVTLPTDSGLTARALILFPKVAVLSGGVIAIPPATESREDFAGISEGSKPAAWLKALLARNMAVAIPITIERTEDHVICRQAGGKDRRRVLWRAAFIVGRTLVGLEVQQAIVLRQYLSTRAEVTAKPIAAMGDHQGGMTALYAAAVDQRFWGVAILDYFQQRENCWQEPVDRTINGQLNEFGDAEVAALIAPRPLFIGSSTASAIPQTSVSLEFARAERFYRGLKAEQKLVALEAQENPMEAGALDLANLLGTTASEIPPEPALQISSAQVDQARNQQFESWFKYLQKLIAASAQTRKQYWQLDSTPAAHRPQKSAKLRAELSRLVGVIHPDIPMNARTKLIAETDKFLAYDVFLDVIPGVEVYGQLLVPRSQAATWASAFLPWFVNTASTAHPNMSAE